MKHINQSAWFVIAIVVFALALMKNVSSLTFQSSKTIPLILCGFVILLGAILLIREVFFKKKLAIDSGPADVKANKVEYIRFKKYLPISLWIFGLFGGISLLGFIITTPLFVGSYMKQQGSKWGETLVTTTIFTTIFIVIFNYLLKVNLYEGLIPPLLNS